MEWSKIQNMINESNAISDFKSEINKLNEKYNIECEVFGIAENGRASTVKHGYLIVREELESLKDALKEMKSHNDAIYIVDKDHVMVGEHLPYLDESMSGKKIIDCNSLREINL